MYEEMYEILEPKMKDIYVPSFRTRTVPYDSFDFKLVQYPDYESNEVFKPYNQWHTSTSFDGCYTIYGQKYLFTLLLKLESPKFTPIIYLNPFSICDIYVSSTYTNDSQSYKPVRLDSPSLVHEAEAVIYDAIKVDDITGVVFHKTEKEITNEYEKRIEEFKCKHEKIKSYTCLKFEYNYEATIRTLDWLKNNFKTYKYIPHTDFNTDIYKCKQLLNALLDKEYKKEINYVELLTKFSKCYLPFIKGICEIYEVNYEDVIMKAIRHVFEYVKSNCSLEAATRFGIKLNDIENQINHIVYKIIMN